MYFYFFLNFAGLLLDEGVSQLKEKWTGYRNPKKMKKPVSMFISPRGERVAVAAGNQVTILRKEDDYQEPCGIFTCKIYLKFMFLFFDKHMFEFSG